MRAQQLTPPQRVVWSRTWRLSLRGSTGGSKPPVPDHTWAKSDLSGDITLDRSDVRRAASRISIRHRCLAPVHRDRTDAVTRTPVKRDTGIGALSSPGTSNRFQVLTDSDDDYVTSGSDCEFPIMGTRRALIPTKRNQSALHRAKLAWLQSGPVREKGSTPSTPFALLYGARPWMFRTSSKRLSPCLQSLTLIVRMNWLMEPRFRPGPLLGPGSINGWNIPRVLRSTTRRFESSFVNLA